jgi:hypothetical protein
VEHAVQRLFPHLVATLVLALAVVATAAPASGQASRAEPPRSDPSPGTYQTEGGWGVLRVTREGPATLRFRLRTEGANGHSCGLDGAIQGGIASLSPEGAGEVCRVFFGRDGEAVVVSTNGVGACRYYCGARASFEGRYLPSRAGCSEPERKVARREFKARYDAGEYAAALARLQPVLERCAGSTPWLEAGWIRNDVAITQFRLGAPADCLRTLAPLRADAARSEAEIREAFPPSDADRYLGILRATRSNAARCEAAAAR